MSYAQRAVVAVTTDADGDATEYSAPLNGILSAIAYVKTDFADGVDFTITTEDSGQTLWTEANVDAAAVRAPRQPTHAGDGTPSLFAAEGEPVEAPIVLADERVKIVVAQGGATASGAFHIIVC